MKQMICSYETLDLLKKNTPVQRADLPNDSLFGLAVTANPYMPGETWSGKYILPNGSVVDPENVRVEERFCSYGPEDIWYLLWAGIILKDMQSFAYVLNRRLEEMIFKMEPMFELPPYDGAPWLQFRKAF